MVLNEITNSQNQSSFNSFLQDNSLDSQQAQKFSNLFYQFTNKVDNSSNQIEEFYDSYMLKKLELAEQHISQISKLSQLQQARKRVQSNINQFQHSDQMRESLKDLKRVKIPFDEEISPKKLFDDNFLKDLSSDLLQLEIDFIQAFEQPSSQLSGQNPLNQSHNQQQQDHNNTQYYNQTETIGEELICNEQKDNQQNGKDNNTNKNQRQSTNENQIEEINQNMFKQDYCIQKKSTNSNNLEVQNKETQRKSLIKQFSEIKVSDKTKIKSENNLIQEQIDKISIEEFCFNIVPQPDLKIFLNSNQNLYQTQQQEIGQLQYLNLKQSSMSSDQSIPLLINESFSNEQAIIMKPQQRDDFQINKQITTQNPEEINDKDTDNYEITDYSSNNSSNLGSPVFNWISKDENQKISNQQQQSNNQNTHPKQISFGCFSQQVNLLDYLNNSNSCRLNKNQINSKLYETNFLQQNSQQENMLKTQIIQSNFIEDDYNNDNEDDYQNKKLLFSPQKLKTEKQRKILYCNNKEVPSWAQDLSKVTQQVRQQNERRDDPTQLFGQFSVENLNLREVFKNTGKRYDQGRGSSANWRQSDFATQEIENLIISNLQTPKNQKKQSKFKSFLSNSINSIKKTLMPWT